MKKYAFIQNGIVESIIEGKVDSSRNWSEYYGEKKGMLCVAIPENESVGIGFKYADGVFQNPVTQLSEAELLEQWRSTFSVPTYKLEIELEERGLMTTVQGLIDDASRSTQIGWEKSPTVRRMSPTVLTLAQHPSLALTAEDLDDIFKSANLMEL